MMHNILLNTIFILTILIGILAFIGIIIENEYLIYVCLIMAFIMVMCAILMLGVNYV